MGPLANSTSCLTLAAPCIWDDWLFPILYFGSCYSRYFSGLIRQPERWKASLEAMEARCSHRLNGMLVFFSGKTHSPPLLMPEDSLTITLFSLNKLKIHVPKNLENNFTILCDLNFSFSWNYTTHSISEGKSNWKQELFLSVKEETPSPIFSENILLGRLHHSEDFRLLEMMSEVLKTAWICCEHLDPVLPSYLFIYFS